LDIQQLFLISISSPYLLRRRIQPIHRVTFAISIVFAVSTVVNVFTVSPVVNVFTVSTVVDVFTVSTVVNVLVLR
jgi:hypothetical protein